MFFPSILLPRISRGCIKADQSSFLTKFFTYDQYLRSIHDLIQVEACDLLGGFALLQSMAGGTGAGLGTYVAQVWMDGF